MKLRINENQQEKIIIDYYDSYANWSSGSLNYYIDGDIIAYINIQVNEYIKEIHIDMIYVDSNYRRQGIATKMFNRLRNEFPDYYIDWGYTLQDGEKLKNALTKEVVNKEYIELSNKIHKIDNELQKIEQNMDNAEWFDDSIQEERDLIGIKWEQLYDEKRELEDEIQDIRPYLTVWK